MYCTNKLTTLSSTATCSWKLLCKRCYNRTNTSLCWPCADHVLAMCWPCAGPMCWPCAGHVLAMCHWCLTLGCQCNYFQVDMSSCNVRYMVMNCRGLRFQFPQVCPYSFFLPGDTGFHVLKLNCGSVPNESSTRNRHLWKKCHVIIMSTHSPLVSFPPSQESGRRPYKLPMCAESAYYVKKLHSTWWTSNLHGL